MKLIRKDAPCGCKIIGRGDKLVPLEILFCTKHQNDLKQRRNRSKTQKPEQKRSMFPPVTEIEVI